MKLFYSVRHNLKAFTLVEIMLASAILVSIMAVSLSSFNSTLQTTNYTQGISLAIRAAQNKLEEMVSADFDTLVNTYGIAPNNTFDFNVSGLNGKGYINITDRKDLYGAEVQAIAAANFPGRSALGALVYDNKMWVLGGTGVGSPPVALNDVWYSADGINWTMATNNSAWSGRQSFATLAYDNKMWVLGGAIGNQYYNDVWYSVNGVNWTLAVANASWEVRSGFTALTYDNRMWVFGGLNMFAWKNDVWYSYDGVNWTMATNSSPWSVRGYHRALVYNNKMWIMGGYSNGQNKNDVWYSTDGSNWICATNAADWPPRYSFATTVYDNKMWVFGGYVSASGVWEKKDVWYSTNGINWTRGTDSAAWPIRRGYTVLNYNNNMWVLGGIGDVSPYYLNDVWYSGGYNRLLDVFVSVSWKHPDGRIFGEDINLNGTIDIGEDINNNSILDSPAQARVLISGYKSKGLNRIFLGK